MNAKHLLVTLVLLAAPLAHASVEHLECESDTSGPFPQEINDEWSSHKYLSPANGLTLGGFIEGNADDCNGDDIPFDYDGHSETATGGAWLLACDWFCGWLYWESAVGSATTCFGEPAHHPRFGPFHVEDRATGPNVTFYIGADYDHTVTDPTGDDCGNGLDDILATCFGSCKVDFLPGTDGAYHLYVEGTEGIASTGGASAPLGSVTYAECGDGLDNEAIPDGLIDYPSDLECATPWDDSEHLPGQQQATGMPAHAAP